MSGRDWKYFWFGLPLLIIGTALLVDGLVETVALDVAPVCAPGQVVDCRLHEQVTVLDINVQRHPPANDYTRSGRGGFYYTWYVHVQLPDGSTQGVQVQDDINFLLHFVGPGEKLNAELWRGRIIRMDYSGGGIDIVLIPEDSPEVKGPEHKFWGTIIMILGGIFLAVFWWPFRLAGRS